LGTNLDVGGAELVFCRLASGWADRGHKVDAILLRADGPLISQLSVDVKIVDFAWPRHCPLTKPWRHLTLIVQLTRYLRSERPDTLITAGPGPTIAALLARAWIRSPTRIVIRVFSVYSKGIGASRGLKGRLRRRLVRLYRAADAIVTDSQGTARDVIAAGSAPQDRVRVVYNPAIPPDLHELAACQSSLHPWLRAGLPPVVLGVGRLAVEKDFATLLRAFSLVHKDRAVRLVIIGEGPERRALEELSRALGIDHDVQLPGIVGNPYPNMRNCSVFVLASRQESMSLVLVEALALGAPVVATDCDYGPGDPGPWNARTHGPRG
jgi:glycosyltransferase involved in cell wall biosynthesis